MTRDKIKREEKRYSSKEFFERKLKMATDKRQHDKRQDKKRRKKLQDILQRSSLKEN